MPNLNTPFDSSEQAPPTFERLADARRCLRIAYNLERQPVMLATDRAQIQRIKMAATVCLGAAIEELVETLDLTDLESPDSVTASVASVFPATFSTAWCGEYAIGGAH